MVVDEYNYINANEKRLTNADLCDNFFLLATLSPIGFEKQLKNIAILIITY